MSTPSYCKNGHCFGQDTLHAGDLTGKALDRPEALTGSCQAVFCCALTGVSNGGDLTSYNLVLVACAGKQGKPAPGCPETTLPLGLLCYLTWTVRFPRGCRDGSHSFDADQFNFQA